MYVYISFGKPIICIGFLRTLLLAIWFSNALGTPKTLETSRAVGAFKTFKTHSTLETLDAFETPEAPIAFETRFYFLSVLRLVHFFYFRERPQK